MVPGPGHSTWPGSALVPSMCCTGPAMGNHPRGGARGPEPGSGVAPGEAGGQALAFQRALCLEKAGAATRGQQPPTLPWAGAFPSGWEQGREGAGWYLGHSLPAAAALARDPVGVGLTLPPQTRATGGPTPRVTAAGTRAPGVAASASVLPTVPVRTPAPTVPKWSFLAPEVQALGPR